MADIIDLKPRPLPQRTVTITIEKLAYDRIAARMKDDNYHHSPEHFIAEMVNENFGSAQDLDPNDDDIPF